MKIAELLDEAAPVVHTLRVMGCEVTCIRATYTRFVTVIIAEPGDAVWERLQGVLPPLLGCGTSMRTNPVDGNYEIRRNGVTISVRRSHADSGNYPQPDIDPFTAARFVAGLGETREIQATTQYGDIALVTVIPVDGTDPETFAPQWCDRSIIHIHVERPA